MVDHLQPTKGEDIYREKKRTLSQKPYRSEVGTDKKKDVGGPPSKRKFDKPRREGGAKKGKSMGGEKRCKLGTLSKQSRRAACDKLSQRDGAPSEDRGEKNRELTNGKRKLLTSYNPPVSSGRQPPSSLNPHRGKWERTQGKKI